MAHATSILPIRLGRSPWLLAALVGLAAIWLWPGRLSAAPADTVPESIWLDGQRLLGLRVADAADGSLRIVVRRVWLEKHAPALHQRTVRKEAEREREVWQGLRERLLAWKEERAEEPAIVGYLERQIERLDKLLAPADPDAPPKRREPAQLLTVQLSRREVKRYLARPALQRTLLALAWEHRLDEPESRSSAELKELLAKKKIDPAVAEPDLSDRVAAELPDDRQWTAKRALVEFSLLGRPQFQGAGGTLLEVKDGEPAPVDPGALLSGMLGEELGKLLGGNDQPAAPPDVSGKATQAAEKAGLRGVRVTQLLTATPGSPVRVRGRFLVQTSADKWEDVWTMDATADPQSVTDEELDALRNDPQIEKLTGALDGLGQGGGGALDLALRHGAATEKALNEVNRRFASFLLRSTRRLDGPTAWLGK